MNKIALTGLAAIVFGFLYLNQMHDIEPMLLVATAVFALSHILLAVPNWLFDKVAGPKKAGKYRLNRSDLTGVLFFSSITTVLLAQKHVGSIIDSVFIAVGTGLFILTSVKIVEHVTKVRTSVSQSNIVGGTPVNHQSGSLNQSIFYFRVLVLAMSASAISHVAFRADPKDWSSMPATYFGVLILLLIPISLTVSVWRSKTYNPALISAKEQQWNAITTTLESKAPKVLLHHAGPVSKKLTDAIKMLNEMKIPYATVLRDQATYNSLKAKKFKNLILCTKMTDLETLISPSVKAIIYTNNRAKNGHLIRFHQLNHVLWDTPENALEISPTYGMFTSRIERVRTPGNPITNNVHHISGQSLFDISLEDALIQTIDIKQ